MVPVPTTSPGAPGANPFEQARIAARELARLTGADRHDALVVLGTGLFPVAELLGASGPPVDLTSLPWFTRFTGPGHRPEAWSVAVGASRTLVVAGRLHLYEARSPAEVVHTVRTAIAAGVRTFVLTCSAGAVATRFAVGDVVAIADHLNLTGQSPLTGVPPDQPFGSRHVDMTDTWSPRLRSIARSLRAVDEGVYAQVPGPQLETPAEVRMLGILGADLVGMSIVPEAIAARHLGAEVLGLAVVTNAAAGTTPGPLDVDGIVAAATASVQAVADLVHGVLDSLAGPDAEPAPGNASVSAVERSGGEEPGASYTGATNDPQGEQPG
jgi:purine-nucleoside phosphorylase